MKVLCLSNGHGEDAIALRILQKLRQHPAQPQIMSLPLVGVGRVYTEDNIPIAGSTKQMPSGGFVTMDGRHLVRDIKSGLLNLTLDQIRTVRSWARQGNVILAVGDIVPLLFAWLSGAPYAFVGTAKSEYYLRDEAGWLPRRSWIEHLEGWSGSVYLPWERWLMSRPRCKAVFPRDRLTSRVLKQWSIPVFDLGNPMMDGLESNRRLFQSFEPSPEMPLTFVLLPGSRTPEAYENWQKIAQAAQELALAFRQQPLLFLGAIAPHLELDRLRRTLQSQGWLLQKSDSDLVFTQRDATLVLTQAAFADCLNQADFAIAMAGTATEQFAGLGKPAIILPGKGPQFTPAFAEAQTRLLGASVTLVNGPSEVPRLVRNFLKDPDRLQLVAENGRRRLGDPGAAQRIADCLMTLFADAAIPVIR